MAKLHGKGIATCPNCNEPIGDQHPVTWCEACGELLPEGIKVRIPSLSTGDSLKDSPQTKITCPSCGSECLPSERTCSDCGKHLARATAHSAPQSNAVSRLMKRYKDAYLVSSATVGFGTLLKVVGVIAAIAIAIPTLIAGSNFRDQTQQLFVFALGISLAAGIGAIIFALGILVSAQGQILRASLDSAVNTSTFLTNEHRAKIMSL